MQLFRTTVAGRQPTAAQIKEGQLAVNLTDKKLYTKVGTTIISVGHGSGATIAGDNTWTGKVKSGSLETTGTLVANRVETGTQVITGNASFNTFTASGGAGIKGKLTVDGDVQVNGATVNAKSIKANGTFESVGSATIRGALELYGATPYIDFHHNNSTADYTSRIIASGAKSIDISSENTTVTGTLNVNNVLNVNAGISVKRPIVIRPQDGGNAEWANIGFYDAGNAGAQRGAVWCDQNGSIGLMSRGNNSINWSSDKYLRIPSGELEVGTWKGGTGENQEARDKSKFYNKGWMQLAGVNAYQDNNDPNGRWNRQVNGLRMFIGDTDLTSEDYFVERVGERHFRAIHVGGANSNGWFEFRNNGDYSCNGVSYAAAHQNVSDKRLKENLKVIPSALNKINKLTAYSYDLHNAYDKAQVKKSVGLIAQDVQKVLPEAVSEIGVEDYIGLDYSAVTSLLVNAVKELNKEVQELKSEIKSLTK